MLTNDIANIVMPAGQVVVRCGFCNKPMLRSESDIKYNREQLGKFRDFCSDRCEDDDRDRWEDDAREIIRDDDECYCTEN